MTELTIPEITEDDDTISAALKYRATGWYVLPVSRASKHAGSVLGKGWPAKSSRDVDQIVTWFAGSSHSLALHMGRSGAVAFDVDHPERIPDALSEVIASTGAPYQSTRANQAGRGHYIFGVPQGRTLGNGTGDLGKGWGEVRGQNGIIVVSPSVHEKEADGARYQWQRTGPVPVLPTTAADLLRDAGESGDAATDEQLKAFINQHTDASRPELLGGILTQFTAALDAGESRHEIAVRLTASAVREAAAGLYPARAAAEQLFAAFADAMTRSRGGGERVITRSMARSEYLGVFAWAIGQLTEDDITAVRRRVAVELQQPRPYRSQSGGSALVGLVRAVLDAEDGQLNSRLRWAARKAFEHAAAGRIDAGAAERALIRAAVETGLPELIAQRTVASARGTSTGVAR